jgi:hypothetical protein
MAGLGDKHVNFSTREKAKAKKIIYFKNGQRIVRKGEKEKRMYIILEGSVVCKFYMVLFFGRPGGPST